MVRRSLDEAKINKADEFYTQMSDIETELRHYKDQFIGKIVFCNCDDPYESNFFKYFALNFNYLKLKKLIATSFSGSSFTGTQLSLFDVKGLYLNGEDNNPACIIEISEVNDENADGATDLSDVEYLIKNNKNTLKQLEGNGDFRSNECMKLLEQADIVATNPPFSLFREYVNQLITYEKQFIIIGNQNALTYKEIFPLIKDNKIWLGYNSGDMEFVVPNYYKPREVRYREENGIKYRSMGNICWFTNLDTLKRHENLELYRKYNPNDYSRYDNFEAINVDLVADIPYDYDEPMGVPITFLDKYNPDQFEILGITKTWFGGASKIYPNQVQVSTNGKQNIVSKLNDGATIKLEQPPVGKTYYIVDDEFYIQKYARILIRKKRD